MMEVKDNMGEKFHANLPVGRQGRKQRNTSPQRIFAA
jgi:hypothetical protein